ncbi:MAG TPA: rhomboid family intramembrane serine protease [Blastocatellia bacterium]|nr:rhomboid family intramembrane serine protease [Blastocatellia bacterium]
MLLPIGDDNTERNTTPFVTWGIIAANVLVFVFLQGIGRTKEGEAFTYGFSVVPYEITHNVDLKTPTPIAGAEPEGDPRLGPRRVVAIPQMPGPSPIWLTLFTAMFMHGGFAHIGFNMLFLWVFGDNIEDNFGHLKFLLFYVLSGLAASFAQIVVNPDSLIPNLGASGAIAGVMGAYIIMFPHNRVRTLLPLGIFWTTIEVPALVALGLWIVTQIFSQYTASFQHTQGGGVAYMAHIGGFAAGLVMSFIFRRRKERLGY